MVCPTAPMTCAKAAAKALPVTPHRARKDANQQLMRVSGAAHSINSCEEKLRNEDDTDYTLHTSVSHPVVSI